MEFIKRYKKLRLRKRKLDLVKLIMHYRSGKTNKQVRNLIVKNYLGINRIKWLTTLEERDRILTEFRTSSKRVKEILESL